MKSRTFTFKIFLCFCLVILFSVLVPSAYVLHNLRQESIELTTEAAQREAAFFQRYLLNELEKKKVPSEEALVGLLQNFSSSSDSRMTLVRSDGTVIYDSFFSQNPRELDNHLQHDEVGRAFAEGFGTSVRKSVTMNELFVYAALRLDHKDGPPFVVRVSAPLSLVESYARDRSRALLISALAAFLLACAFAAFLSIRFRRSLRLMITSVENLAMPGVRSGRINLRTLQDFWSLVKKRL